MTKREISRSLNFESLRGGDIHYVNIAAGKPHKILSADPYISSLIHEDIYSPFENNVLPEEREIFLRRLSENDGEWFPLHLMTKEGAELFCLRFEHFGTEFSRFAIVRFIDFVNNHKKRMSMIWSISSILDLYDDVSFVYHPKTDTVELFHADHAVFTRMHYRFEEFRTILLFVAKGEEQENTLLGFLNHIREQHAYFTAHIDGNLIGTDETIRATHLVGHTEIRGDDEVEVVGIIHPERSGRATLSGLKRDFLTGAVLKEDITLLATHRVNDDRLDGTAIAIVDVDYFKSVNDIYGHKKGDWVLQRVAELIANEIGSDGLLGRIGGDEFMIVFFDMLDETLLRMHLHNIKNQVLSMFPDLGPNAATPLSVSIGCAVYPQDAATYDDLFMMADYCLYLAKNKGRNRYIIYKKALHPSLALIRSSKMSLQGKAVPRATTALSDTILNMYYEVLHDRKKPRITNLLSDFALSVHASNMLLFIGEPYHLFYESGPERFRDPSVCSAIAASLQTDLPSGIDRNFLVVNRVENLPDAMKETKAFLEKHEILSFIEMRFRDAEGQPAVLLLLSIGRYTQWNQLHLRHYQLYLDLLKHYDLRADTQR